MYIQILIIKVFMYGFTNGNIYYSNVTVLQKNMHNSDNTHNSMYLLLCVVNNDQITTQILTVLSAGAPGLVVVGENIESVVAFEPLLWQIYRDSFFFFFLYKKEHTLAI